MSPVIFLPGNSIADLDARMLRRFRTGRQE